MSNFPEGSEQKCCIRRKFHFTFDLHITSSIDSIFIVHLQAYSTFSEIARGVRHALKLVNACDFSSIYDFCIYTHLVRAYTEIFKNFTFSFYPSENTKYFHNIASSLMYRKRKKKNQTKHVFWWCFIGSKLNAQLSVKESSWCSLWIF